MKIARPTLLPALLVLLGGLLLAPAAVAEDASVDASAGATSADPLQSRVDAVLAEFGGTQTAPNEISWDGGATTLDLAPDPADPGTDLLRSASTLSLTATTVGGCASGRHCIYSGSGYTGDKVTFSGCATNESVALLDGYVRSVVNETASSMVRVYAGSTLLVRVAAGRGKNVTGAATRISCS